MRSGGAPLSSQPPPLPSPRFFPSLPSPPLPFPFLPFPPLPSFPLPSLPLEVGPLNPARVSGGALSAVSSPSGVWGGAPAEIDFGAFYVKIWHLVPTILMIFLRIN